MKYFLSHYQLRKIFYAWKLKNTEVNVSLNLNKTQDIVKIKNNVVEFPDGSQYDINTIYKLSKDIRSIFMFKDGEIYKVELFSEKYGRYYKLVNNGEFDFPNLEISGVKIFKNKEKPIKLYIKSISKDFRGNCALVIGVKLGYLPIELTKNFKKVIVLENDENIVEIMRYNPWSQEFFESEDITYYICEPYREVRTFEESIFDSVFLTSYKNNNKLYISKLFFKDVYLILKKGGVFVVESNEKDKGKLTSKLKQSGFKKIYKKNNLIIAAK